MAVFWVVAPCGLVWVYRRFRGLYCLCPVGHAPLISTDLPRAASLIALMMEAVQTSENLVNSYQSIWRYNPEDRHLQLLMCFRNFFPEEEFVGFPVLSVFKYLLYRDNEKYFIIAALRCIWYILCKSPWNFRTHSLIVGFQHKIFLRHMTEIQYDSKHRGYWQPTDDCHFFLLVYIKLLWVITLY
jgi:hypothetical protein